jgi:tRNA (cmo5U34)-methyltransferase
VLNLTLQFVEPEARLDLLRRLRAGLAPGAALILVEKVVWPDAGTDALMAALHHDFKRAQGYSDMEIARKRAALDEILVPDDIETHEHRLRDVGFRRIERWYQCLNFVGWLARD